MSFAYVDTSYLVAIAFDEPGARRLAGRLERFERRSTAANLLEAELRAALARERVWGGDQLLASITWVYPNRPLTQEFERIVPLGPLKGADVWHLACALFLAPAGRDLVFLTLDKRQHEVAARLGFGA